MSTYFSLSRLVVYKRGIAVYDQMFRDGVNIIHGSNGSGKSTIADFIFYALGGELKEWKEHAILCDEVVAEIVGGSAVLTLRRPIAREALRPMNIFFGPYVEAMKHAASGWQQFDYKRGDKGHSFSQVLFKAIGIPESQGDGSSNLTMHQLLRLLYSDQMTPVQRIFRSEPFDSWDTRQAVGDLICGVGGYDLLDKRIALREAEKRWSDVNAEYRSLVRVAVRYGDDVRKEIVEKEIAKAQARREQLYVEREQYLRAEKEGKKENSEAEKQRKRLFGELSSIRAELFSAEEEVKTLEYEIEDSNLFIKYLRSLLSSFDDAAATYNALGEVRFEHCPSCLRKVDNSPDLEKCHLCGSTVDEKEKDSRILALKLDFQLQLRESISLQKDREELLSVLRAKVKGLSSQHRRLSEAYNALTRAPLSARDAKIGELSREIGFIDSSLETLEKRAGIGLLIDKLLDDRDMIRSEINALKSYIEMSEESQKNRKQQAYSRISNVTMEILSEDLEQQNDFENMRSFSFSFGDDWMAINGERNVSKSASGMVVLKNSFHMALLVSALQDRLFNMPAFLLFDNIEDKGMVTNRSWNFQDLIVDYSERSSKKHQIIFTTSMLSPNLVDSGYVIGGQYSKERRTLNLLG